jgi:hypothetical protein
MKGKQAHLNAHVDHSYFVSKNVMITTAWVRDNSSIQIKTTLHSGGGEVITKSIKSFNFIRPDVNKHFNDSDEVKSGIFYIFEIESDFEKTDLTIKISLGGVEKELNANITDDAKSVMTALSLMESIEFEELNNSLLKKYSSLLILQADGKKMGPETLPGSLKIEIEHAFSITGYGVFLQGWLIDADSNLAGIHIKQGSHVSNNLLESSTRFVRPDVNSLFPQYISSQCSAGLFGIAVNNQFINGLNYELIMVTRTGDITTQVLEVITKSGDTVELIRSLLTPLDLTKARYQEELSGYLGEAIAYIWKNKALPKQVVEIIED